MDLQIRNIDGSVYFLSVVIGEEAGIGESPSEKVMNNHYGNLSRRMSVLMHRSLLVLGAADLFVGTGNIGVDFANLGDFTSGFAIPSVSR